MKNRTVLLTGASSGIGYELTKIFAKEKNNLILVARNRKRLEEIRTELTPYGIEVTLIDKDLSQPNAAEELYREVTGMGKRVDVLVNNAGYGIYGPFDQSDLNRHLNMIQLNIVALTQLTHLFVQDMVKQKYGRILNLGSLASFVATPSMGVYAATKAFVLSFSESLNTELRNKGDIAVTALCPGPTKTNFAATANFGSTAMFDRLGLNAIHVAQVGYDALEKGKPIAIPGWHMRVSLAAVLALPRAWAQKLMRF